MLTRRVFLNMIVAGSSIYIAPSLALSQTALNKKVPLWNRIPDDEKGPQGAMIVEGNGGVYNISSPYLDVFIPKNPNGSAVIVAAGGGYQRIQIGLEATPAIEWLNKRGIIACILYYRLPQEGWLSRPLAPLQDAQRAMRLIRSGHITSLVDNKKIGILGFSAGGHLLGLMAGCSNFNSYSPQDDIDYVSAHADLTALIYPVITLKPPYDNTSTRRTLIGDTPTKSETRLWSVESHVNRHYPTTFLLQAKDDNVANPNNTLIMEETCYKMGVPVERHLLENGGHGFGWGQRDNESYNWPLLFEKWLQSNGMMSN